MDMYILSLGKPLKRLYFSGQSTKRGAECVRGCSLRKKDLFFLYPFFCPLSRGGGAKGLSGLSTKKRTFLLFAASLLPAGNMKSSDQYAAK